ncbi:hypothetical protein ACELLULO517_04555 [Acidisoma cellulosilytica]|uniref:Uncharacterized protein n=1 Tax=Acidisoma cellulosilyticum TaxID=2802395 RepID=A0A963YYC1_9PROT|nr:hypothetical protein [Acidisoma cellulosilyticum]MCB8879493.1 hypothetical protein [Acidisoma cellulosilyticum]
MKSGLFLSATASLMLLGSTAVFAQQYAAPNAISLTPGQAPTPVAAAAPAPTANVGIVFLKPGETVNTASAQDLGAGSTHQERAGAFQLLEPGQAG